MWYFQQKYEKFSGEGAQPLTPVGRGIGGEGYPLPTPYPLGACGTSTHPILKSWVCHCTAWSAVLGSRPTTTGRFLFFSVKIVHKKSQLQGAPIKMVP